MNENFYIARINNKLHLKIAHMFLFLCCCLALYFSQDWAGWLVCGASFYVLLIIPNINLDRKLYIVSLFVLLAHHLVSIVNSYIMTIFGGGFDAMAFYKKGLIVAKTGVLFKGIGSGFYSNLLGIAYHLNASQFFSQEITVLIFVCFLVFLIKLMDLLNLKSGKFLVVAFVGFIPHTLLWTSILLREAYQMLFLCAGLYFGICYHVCEKKKFQFFLFLLCFVFLGLFHWIFPFYICFLIFLFMIWPFQKWKITLKKLLIYSMILFGLVLFIVFFRSGLFLYEVKQIINHLTLNFYQHKQILETVNSADSTYAISVSFLNVFSIISSILSMWYHYLFTFLPKEGLMLSFGIQVYLVLNVFFRTLLLALILIQLLKSSDNVQKRIILFLLTVYLSLTGLWSLGTLNYGTALRHQMTTEWIIIMLGIPILFDQLTSNKAFNKVNFPSKI